MSDSTKILNESPMGIYTIQFSEAEVDALLQILTFASSAASVLAYQEMKVPNGVKNAAKMNQVASDAKELIRIVSMSVEIGEPSSEELN